MFNLLFPFTLNQLRIIKAIADCESFEKAANNLHLSQSTISLQVKKLEQNLNLLLFERGKKKAKLTSAGYILLRYSERILSLSLEVCQVLERTSTINIINLGTNQINNTSFIPHLLALLEQIYPQNQIKTKIECDQRVIWGVINGEIDLAIIEDEIPINLINLLQIKKCYEDEFVLIVSPSHPLSKFKTIKEKDLCHLKYITLDNDNYYQLKYLIAKVLKKSNINTEILNTKIVLDSIEALKNAVNANLGVSFLPQSSICRELESGFLHSIKIENVSLERTLFIISSSSNKVLSHSFLNKLSDKIISFFFNL
uniref:Probable RuBisCO transcriptional regulator n=1 Tax=Olisthodiscus luteus TaxID=83000 RepID=A0A7U0KSM4_OLILU|nr:RuBisCO transcriptional regulator [Olisthodiscus luteus]QQW50479.1 RuBisCO transcriptional regulator [Olisthodiscus luteus]